MELYQFIQQKIKGKKTMESLKNISKETFIEFVKKIMKEKCVKLISGKLENDPKNWLYEINKKY